MTGAALLFGMLVCHALCDYPLQTDFVAKGKNRHTPVPGVPWPYLLSAHALIHGGAVALLTGSLLLGCLETALHWGIDYAKCEGWTGIHTDQALHVACKIVWLLVEGTGTR